MQSHFHTNGSSCVCSFPTNRGVRFAEKQPPFPTVEITEKDKGKTYISAFKKPYNR